MTSRARASLVVLLVAGSAIATSVGTSPANALSRQEIQLSIDHLSGESSGHFDVAQPGGGGTTPEGCDGKLDADTTKPDPSEVTCDLIPVTLDATGWDSDDFIDVKFTLSWPVTQENDTYNVPDIDMFIYDADHPPPQAPNDPSWTSLTGSGTTSGSEPEEGGFDITTRNVLHYYVVLSYFAGGPVDYKLTASIRSFVTKPIPKFERPDSLFPEDDGTDTPADEPSTSSTEDGTSSDAGSGPASRRPFTGPSVPLSAPSRPSTPGGPTIPPVLTPGPDGATTAFALTGVPANARIGGGSPWWVVLLTVVLTAGALGVPGFLLVRRVRARSP